MTADTSRVPHDKLMTLAAEAEMEEWPVTSAWYWPRMMALDLRDARTTLAERDREVERLKADVVDAHTVLQAAEARVRVLEDEVRAWRECALYDATMQGPVFKGWDRSALDRLRTAALSDTPKGEPAMYDAAPEVKS